MTKVAIFASGSGSNAENIALHFKGSNSVIVDCIISNKSDAYVLERAKKMGIESAVFSGKYFAQTDEVLNYLHSRGVDFIVLAGFFAESTAKSAGCLSSSHRKHSSCLVAQVRRQRDVW